VIFAFSTVSERETMTRPSRSISLRRRRDSMVLPEPMTAVSQAAESQGGEQLQMLNAADDRQRHVVFRVWPNDGQISAGRIVDRGGRSICAAVGLVPGPLPGALGRCKTYAAKGIVDRLIRRRRRVYRSDREAGTRQRPFGKRRPRNGS
jgi:hypothetical protein